MLKIVIIVCALFGILTAVSIESWLRRHPGNIELAKNVYDATLEKYSEFCLALLLPLGLIVVAIGVLVLIVGDINLLIGFVAGVLSVALSVFVGSRSFTSATVSASSIAFDGDIKRAMRSAFRGGSVAGILVPVIGTGILCLLYFIFKLSVTVEIMAVFGLGAAVCGLFIRLSGSILTSAHKLSDSDEHNVDYVGAYAANAADFAESFMLSAGAAILLADVGVETSGVSTIFTAADAAKFPLLVLACGIVASIIGILTYRSHTGKYSHFGFTAGGYVAGALVMAASIYLSMSILESRAYAYCIGFGILATLISGEFCKYYSMDSEVFLRNLPYTQDEDIDIPMLHGLSVGLISSFVPGLITAVAMVLSFNLANYYGVALAAVGAGSISAFTLNVREYATTVSASCSFAEAADHNAEDNQPYYNILRRTSAKAKAAGRAYSTITAAFTLSALMMAFTFRSEMEVVRLSDPVVFGGMISGTLVILLFMGLLIKAILSSTASMLDSSADDPDEYRNIGSVRGVVMLEVLAIALPLAIGFLMGADCVIGFIAASIVTGIAIIYAFNNTGRYYDRTASDALGSIIKIMTASALAAVALFIQYGGVFF
jgi:K(+)-stimulated pyrophosphate-energized sodium pump